MQILEIYTVNIFGIGATTTSNQYFFKILFASVIRNQMDLTLPSPPIIILSTILWSAETFKITMLFWLNDTERFSFDGTKSTCALPCTSLGKLSNTSFRCYFTKVLAMKSSISYYKSRWWNVSARFVRWMVWNDGLFCFNWTWRRRFCFVKTRM